MDATIIDILMHNVNNPGNITQMRPAQNPGTYLIPAYDKYDYCKMGPTYEIIERRLGFIEHKGLAFWKASHIGTIREALETGEPYLPRVWIDRSGNKPIMLGGSKQFMEAAKWLEMSYTCDRCNVFLIRQRVEQLYESTDETLMWNWILKAFADRGLIELFEKYFNKRG